jgi:hypothetical protein
MAKKIGARPKKNKDIIGKVMKDVLVPEISKQLNKYNIRLDMGGKVYEATGDTAHEAIASLPLTFMETKAKGVLTLSHDGKTSSKFFYLTQMRRIIANKMIKIGIAKQLESLLK